jgi:hypothetical protein
VSEGSPPQRPPQISPDGKWVWDGTEWQPVASRDSGHTAVFPAFNSAAIDPTLTAQPAPVPFQAPVAPVNYAANYSVPQQTNAPLWQVKPGHWNKYLYVAAGVIVLVIAGIFLSSLGPISLPWFGGGSQTGTQTPAPSLLSKRSDFAAADQFETGFLQPAIVAMNKSVAAQTLSCNGVLTLSIGCQQALTVTDGQVQTALAEVNKEPPPICIAPSVANIKFDLQRMHAFMQNAFQAFTDNSKPELAAAFAGFYLADHSLQLNVNASKAQAAACDTQVTGP